MSNLKVCSVTDNEKPQLFTLSFGERWFTFPLSGRQVFMVKETQHGAVKARSLLTKIPKLHVCYATKHTWHLHDSSLQLFTFLYSNPSLMVIGKQPAT